MERRRYLDEILGVLYPKVERLRSDVERVLRQRNVLLKQAGGRPSVSVLGTLDVWDAQLARLGSELVEWRKVLVRRLGPVVARNYSALVRQTAGLGLDYQVSWSGELAEALAQRRAEDLRRGVTTLGPHRDDLEMTIRPEAEIPGGPMPARTHASQGEQRSVALALRLAAWELAAEESGEGPVLLLDDVFSELDAVRSAEFVRILPAGQAILTTAGEMPPGMDPAAVMRVDRGDILPYHNPVGG